MDPEFITVLFGVLTILVTLLVMRALVLRSLPQPASRRGKPIPGWDKKPASIRLGDLTIALANGSLFDYLWQQHREGSIPVTSFWWRDQRVVSVCSPQAFKDTEDLYNRPRLIFGQTSEPLHGSKSIQSVNNKEWKERKKLLHDTIGGQRLTSFIDDFVQVANELEIKWTAALSAGKSVNLKKQMFLATLKAILNTSLGNIFNDDKEIEDLANLYHLYKREMDTRILDTPPANSPQEVDFKNNLKRLKDKMRQMMQVRRRQNGNGKELPLLDTLLKSGASEDLILSDMITFLGGFHTSAYYVMWTFYYLSQNPEVQQKLYEEIKEIVGNDRNEKLSSYVTMSNYYLRQVLDESMRISTTANFSAHYPDQDIMVDGYCVPAGTPIVHALGVAMHNNAVWESPNKFNPDRFAHGSTHAKRGHEYRPFGVSNIRRCPANHFTYMMVSVYVTIILNCFTLRPVDEKNVEKVYGTATGPKDDPLVQLELRY